MKLSWQQPTAGVSEQFQTYCNAQFIQSLALMPGSMLTCSAQHNYSSPAAVALMLQAAP
jgi:hypothetical protein